MVGMDQDEAVVAIGVLFLGGDGGGVAKAPIALATWNCSDHSSYHHPAVKDGCHCRLQSPWPHQTSG